MTADAIIQYYNRLFRSIGIRIETASCVAELASSCVDFGILILASLVLSIISL
ncbi:MAG: hypothetical protein JO297_04580 [Nitrososphaeraceae archaeon]|nr:hypothetical protein [Nitrososphaeraceae archaeon]